jgi:hypothetical protein
VDGGDNDKSQAWRLLYPQGFGLVFIVKGLTFLIMASLTIKLPPALKTELEATARLRGWSVSAVVREAVEGRLRQGRRGQKTSLYERTRHLCGCFDSGVNDLATNPKYLEGLGGWKR